MLDDFLDDLPMIGKVIVAVVIVPALVYLIGGLVILLFRNI